MEDSKKWDKCRAFLKKSVSEQAFETWFEPIRFGSFTPKDGGGHLVLLIPSRFVGEFIQKHYLELMSKAITRAFGEGISLTYKIEARAPGESAGPVLAEGAKVAKKAELPPIDSQLNPEYTFENFIEGESNRLTRSIGLSIAEHPEKVTFNPFFLYGPSGVGKTHLANAVGLRVKQLHPKLRVLMVSTHVFTMQYTDSVLHNHTNDFINFYQSIDVLIIDDVQELTTAKTQRTFFHIFNHLHQNRKVIIMTCDRPPVSLEGFQERLLNRFKWGMVAEMERPNIELRRAILQAKMRRNGISFPPDVVDYVVNNVSDNVRELEGVINSIMLQSIIENCEIDLPLAKHVVVRSVNMERKELTVEEIVCRVSQHYSVKPKEVTSSSRKRPIVRVRQICMYLCQKYTDCSLSQIGQRIGRRDHSTVIHSINLVEKQISADRDFRHELEDLDGLMKK